MGALAHYLETAGVPTTQISLIREHTARIQPPRALWVPFELGRPLGLPDVPVFQRRVLLAALALLVFSHGPVLVDFPDDVPVSKDAHASSLADLACPVLFAPLSKGGAEIAKVMSAFAHEVAGYRSWYDLGCARRGYSSVAYFDPENARRLLADFVIGDPLHLPESIASSATALRLAAQDLKAFYFEAAMTRPDLRMTESEEFTRWFWQNTVAGQVLRLVKMACLASGDEHLKMTGNRFLVPLDQA